MAVSPARIIVVMGVSSSGKTTVGRAIARRLHAPFLDGDDFHPPANVEKMRQGIPLEDADRWPWLERLAEALADAAARKGTAVGACSSLKRSYREAITAAAGEPVTFIYLEGTPEVIGERMARRSHEFMPQSLLASQFATLEPPGADENALTVPVTESVDRITGTVLKALGHLRAYKRWQ